MRVNNITFFTRDCSGIQSTPSSALRRGPSLLPDTPPFRRLRTKLSFYRTAPPRHVTRRPRKRREMGAVAKVVAAAIVNKQ